MFPSKKMCLSIEIYSDVKDELTSDIVVSHWPLLMKFKVRSGGCCIFISGFEPYICPHSTVNVEGFLGGIGLFKTKLMG